MRSFWLSIPSPYLEMLFNADFQGDVSEIRTAAEALKQRFEVLTAGTASKLEAAFVTMDQHRVGALAATADPFLVSKRKKLVELAGRHTMLTIYASGLVLVIRFGQRTCRGQVFS
jgi:hypothetical protein